MTRLEALYKSKIMSAMMEQFKYRNNMQVPKLEKIIVSMGVGRSIQDKKLIEGVKNDLAQICGQKPLICKAKISVSNFKLRQGVDIGLKVTLRRAMMYEFLDRLVSLAIPRVRDFRGLNPKSFDGRGNYSMGLTEQAVFPEIDPDKIASVQGMNVAMVTTAKTDDEGRTLLNLLGMPFRN
ncbi:MAG: 50S ribosomal protein L5 [Sedimentisphaerales bacterium]|nr:50S ribosomal protein L5 [Sedimentisphaerales bacterium]